MTSLRRGLLLLACTAQLQMLWGLSVLSSHRITAKGPLRSADKIPSYNPDSDLLVRALKGQVVERTPVWLMRQVGSNELCLVEVCEWYSSWRVVFSRRGAT